MKTSQLPTLRADDEPTDVVGEPRTRGNTAATVAVDGSAPTRHDREAVTGQGLVLGRYRPLKQLGSGAFGTVLSARDERLDRDVALKLLPRERVAHARFEREARAAARLQHPAIVTLYEAAVDDDGAYLVSELVRGKTLDTLLRQGKLSDRDILEIGIALSAALAHAHSQGVIHRDVKPSNVLVPSRPNGPAGRAKLTDFGVAQVLGGESLTRTGDVVGTLTYMAPEQADGREVGPAADLYSLALVLYEALTGINPWRDQGAAQRRRSGTFLPPLRRQRRDLPRELAAGLDRALHPRPAERGTLADLQALLAQSIDLADDTAGVVTGWRAPEPTGLDAAAPGPEWDDQQPPRVRFHGERLLSASTSGSLTAPAWAVRGLNAAAAGAAAAWLSAHLFSVAPLAPAEVALAAAAATLLLPWLGWAAVIAAISVISAAQGHLAGAAALLLVALPVLALLCRERDGAALPGGAIALALVGCAGAWPALVGRTLASWWQRAVVAAFGFVWLAAASALLHRNLYWSASATPVSRRWIDSSQLAIHQLLLPAIRSGALLGAVVWALVAVTLPWLRSRRRPALDVVVAVVLAAVTVPAVQAIGAGLLHDAVVGAVLAAAIGAGPAAISLLRAPTGDA